MAEGLIPSVLGLVRDINTRKKDARIDDQLRNYLKSPDETIAGVFEIDPRTGMKLQEDRVAQQAAQEKLRREKRKESLEGFSRLTRGAAPGTDYGALVDRLTPMLKANGDSDEDIATFRELAINNPSVLEAFDDEAFKNISKDRHTDTVAPAGSEVWRSGQRKGRVPYAPKPVVVRGGDGSSEMRLFDPNEYLDPADVGGGNDAVAGEAEQYEEAPAARGIDPRGPAVAPPGGGGEEMAVGVIKRVEQGRQAAPKGVQTVTQSEARSMQQAWGGGDAGKERFQSWAASRGVRVVPDGQGAPPSALPIERVQPAPAMRATPRSGQAIGERTAPKPTKRLRAATPEELSGYPKGTAAQIDEETGELKNLRTPPASLQQKPIDPLKLEKRNATLRASLDSSRSLRSRAEALLKHPGAEGATGSIQGRLPGLALGQTAEDFINDLTNIKDVTAFNTLMEMKANSPNGASGLGSLTEKEATRLEQLYGTLNRTSSWPTLQKTLREVVEITSRAEQRAAEMMKTTPGQAPAAQQGEKPKPQLGTRIRNSEGRTAILDTSGWVWEDTGKPVGGKKKGK